MRSAKILLDDGVDEARGGHNFASGQGINSVPDPWEAEGPATITPTGDDLAGSLGNFNLTSIVVTRENVGTASLEVTFRKPSTTFFFWERGSAASATTANSDLLVEALDERGRVIASHKLLRCGVFAHRHRDHDLERLVLEPERARRHAAPARLRRPVDRQAHQTAAPDQRPGGARRRPRRRPRLQGHRRRARAPARRPQTPIGSRAEG